MTTNYGTVSGYKTWANARGVSYAGVTDDQIGDSLVRSSEYLDATYLDAWPGIKTDGRTQVRQWPRAWVMDASGYAVDAQTVPQEIEYATYEGAKLEITTTGALTPTIKAGGGVIRRVKAGATEVEYATNGMTTSVFQAIDVALAPLIGGRNIYSGSSARA